MTPAPAKATLSTFAAQIASALEAYHNQANDALKAEYEQAVKEGRALSPPMLTIFDPNVLADMETSQSPIAELETALLAQIQYLPTVTPAGLYTIGAQLAPGVFAVTTTAANWPAAGTVISVNGQTYILKAVSPFRWVAQLVLASK